MVVYNPTHIPLPKLPVVREDYCSQEMTDRIISYIEEKRPGLIEELYEKCMGLTGDYFTSFGKAFLFTRDEASKIMPVPQDPRGYIDLNFELCRRLRKNMKFTPFEVYGNPIAPDVDGPYMPLAKKSISDEALKLGFTQAVMDEAVEQYYNEKPEYWYFKAEALRRAQPLDFPGPIPNVYFLSLIEKRIAVPDDRFKWSFTHELQRNAMDRLRIMCNTPSFI